MKLAVCIKQVPAVSALAFDPATKTIKREGVRSEVSAFDIRALLKAIALRDAHGGEVVAITMGPPAAREALAECLALGADRAVHLCDATFAGADTLATARALAAAVRREQFDLVLCGRNSVDAETGQVGPELAELLDWPQVTIARTLTLDPAARVLSAEREVDAGIDVVRAPLPAVVTAAEDLAPERFTTKAEREAALAKPIATWTAADLGLDAAQVGAKGSPTWVIDLEIVDEQRKREMIEAPTPAEQVEALVTRLLGHGLFGTWTAVHPAPAPLPQPTEPPRSGARDVLVVAETHAGALRPVTLELLAKARALAARLHGAVVAVVAGADAAAHVPTLAAHGAARVIVAADGAHLAGVESAAALLAELLRRTPFGLVLLPATVWGRDVAPRVAARLGLGLTGECVDLTLDAAGRVLQHKPAFGGSVVALIASHTRPELATVRPGMLAAAAPDSARRAEVVDWTAAAIADRVVVLERREDAEAATELDNAVRVVGFGKGLGSADQLPAIEALAKSLDAALCTTRDVTDVGWLPKQYQVGITGRAIAPELYLAVALRGAFEHTVGVRRSGLIVAINKSAKAPIFKSCDYGLVGDWQVLVPLLTARLKTVKASHGVTESRR
jgi:electron transfer flavoprotein alpha subunit